MKRTVALLLTMALCILPLAGCKSNLPPNGGSSSAPESVTSGTPETVSSGAPEPGSEGPGLKTGMAVLSNAAKSANAGPEDGLAQIESNVVAVLVDGEGRIANCKIDSVQNKISFAANGKLLTDGATVFKSKQELGAEYGMGKASGIGKEWNEQADALAEYVTGKTLEELKGIAVDDKGAATDTELSAMVTMSVADYLAAIERAMGTAREAGAKIGDTLGVGLVADISDSQGVDGADAQIGKAQASSTFAAVSLDPSGVITGCILDGTNHTVEFDHDGKITTDIAGDFPTKNELGDSYGMKKASSIGKEWYEQADAYAKYAVGKTVQELSGVAVNEEGKPTGEELTASVTIAVGDFNRAIEKAAARAS